MKTMLIDSNFLCHRAKHTTVDLTFKGIRTGIIYGFFNQFFKITEKINPDLILFFWDSKKSKRKKIFPDYKYKDQQNISEYEHEEWRHAYAQFKQLRKIILPQIGLCNNFIQSGYESDDLLARYVMDHSEDENCIVTGDDDLLQLLDYAYIYNPAKGEYTYRDDFVWAHQIEPSMWGEVKKIAGCTSDKVPGVSGVGKATALKYIRGELKRTTKAYQNIIKNKEVIERNHRLVVLPFDGTKEIIPYENDFSMIEFLRFCRKFGLNSFRQEEKKEKIKQLLSTQKKGKKNDSKKEEENSRHSQNKEKGSFRKRNKKERSTKKRRSTD